MKVYTQLIEGHQALTYAYSAGPDRRFSFHLLSEVGAPWQREAEEMANTLAKARGCVIRQVELSAEPWYVDALVKEATECKARYTLDEALALADPKDVSECKSAFGVDLFEQAVEHHRRRGLTADVKKGTTRDKDGQNSVYPGYDWADRYTTHKGHIWFDFFRGFVVNSASRLSRGLEA